MNEINENLTLIIITGLLIACGVILYKYGDTLPPLGLSLFILIIAVYLTIYIY